MDTKTYERESQKTARPLCNKDKLNNAALGLTGEAGEFADHIKKVLFQGHELDKNYLKKELGDILWYIVEGALALGFTLDDVMKANLEKLAERYPSGVFKEKESTQRAEWELKDWPWKEKGTM